MLEIIRGRNWAVAHTVLDSAEGPPTDLSLFDPIVCQIRQKTATRNLKGFFEHAVVVDVTVETDENILWLNLTAEQTVALQTGDHIIDVVGTLFDGTHESLLDLEPVRVTNRPSLP